MAEKTLKILGMVVSLGGMALTLCGNAIAEKQLDMKIDNKIIKALSEK